MVAGVEGGLGLFGCEMCFFGLGECGLTDLVPWFVGFGRRKEG